MNCEPIAASTARSSRANRIARAMVGFGVTNSAPRMMVCFLHADIVGRLPIPDLFIEIGSVFSLQNFCSAMPGLTKADHGGAGFTHDITSGLFAGARPRQVVDDPSFGYIAAFLALPQ